jgi:hypothetical protein
VVTESVGCPVCGLAADDVRGLASHLVEQAEASEGRHVMWLNRNVTKHRSSPDELEPLLAETLRGEGPYGDRVKR